MYPIHQMCVQFKFASFYCWTNLGCVVNAAYGASNFLVNNPFFVLILLSTSCLLAWSFFLIAEWGIFNPSIFFKHFHFALVKYNGGDHLICRFLCLFCCFDGLWLFLVHYLSLLWIHRFHDWHGHGQRDSIFWTWSTTNFFAFLVVFYCG